MMKVVKAISIDNGGSELRILPNNHREDEVIHVPGDFYEISTDEFRTKEVEDPFLIQRVISAPRTSYYGYIGAGLPAKMYKGQALRMDSTRRKTESEEFYRQIIFGVALSIIKDEELYGIDEATSLELYSDYLNNFIEVVLCTNIPIKEHSGRQDFVKDFKENICGEYEVMFPLLPARPIVRFVLRDGAVGVLPEGGVVVSAVGSSIGDNEYSLVVDLGHVSNDLSIYKGKKLYGNTVISSPRAGSTLIGLVQSALVDRGFQANSEIAITAITTGEISIGKRTEDVSDLIIDCKDQFVKNFVKEDILQIINTAGITPAQVNNIVPVGYLMNESKNLGSITDMIITEMSFTDAEELHAAKDLRYANIMAIDRFTSALSKKREKEIMSEG